MGGDSPGCQRSGRVAARVPRGRERACFEGNCLELVQLRQKVVQVYTTNIVRHLLKPLVLLAQTPSAFYDLSFNGGTQPVVVSRPQDGSNLVVRLRRSGLGFDAEPSPGGQIKQALAPIRAQGEAVDQPDSPRCST